MIVTLVTFPVPPNTPTNMREILENVAPRYQAVDGLERKFFIGNEERAGGVYQWASRQQAEHYYDEAWIERMRSTYGVVPKVEFFSAPCLVDNCSGTIHYADPS